MKLKLWHVLLATCFLLLFLRANGVKFYETLYNQGAGWSVSRFYFNNPIILKPDGLTAYYTIKYHVQYTSTPLPIIPTIYYVVCIDDQCYQRPTTTIVTGSPWRSEVRYQDFKIVVDTSSLQKGFHTAEVYILGLGNGYYYNPEACHTSARVWDVPREEWNPYMKKPQEECMSLDKFLSSVDWIKVAKDAKAGKLHLSNVYVWYSKPIKFVVCEGAIDDEHCGTVKYITKTKTIDCRTTGCPEGYYCTEINGQYVCKQSMSEYTPLLVGLIIIILGIAVAVVYRTVRR